jgi:hypothetical protein
MDGSPAVPGEERIKAYREEKGGDLIAKSNARRSTDPTGQGRSSTYRKAVEAELGSRTDPLRMSVDDDIFLGL